MKRRAEMRRFPACVLIESCKGHEVWGGWVYEEPGRYARESIVDAHSGGTRAEVAAWLAESWPGLEIKVLPT